MPRPGSSIGVRRVALATAGLACVSLTTSALATGGDDAASATLIPGIPFADFGDTTVLTDQFDVVCPFTGSTAPDAWYRYTPQSDVALTVTLCRSNYDTKTYVLDADFNDIGCNDDACTSPSGGTFRSLLENVVVPAGELVYIVVDGWSGDAGKYVLEVAFSGDDPPCALDCPPGSIPEGEPCDDSGRTDHNGGCTSSPPLFTPVSCGDTVCGTAWALNGMRDTDWYELPASDASFQATVTLLSEFEAEFHAIPCTDCDVSCSTESIVVDRCTTESLSLSRQAGEASWWVVARNGFDGLPCTGAPREGLDYILAFSCVAPAPCPQLGDTDGDGVVDFGDLLTVLANWGTCP